jgi:tetratricopeptide (TPR) repeat protein
MAEPITEEAWNAARLRAMGLIERGGRGDLTEAINTYERLRAGTPLDTPIRAVLAAELCLALRLRFAHTRDGADLDAAVVRGREAERGADPRVGPYGYFVVNLIAALTLRSEITGRTGDLLEALRLGEAGLASLPPDDPMHPQLAANYGVAVRVQAELASDPARLDEAITQHERIAVGRQGGLRALTVMNLGSLLRIRYRHSGEPADLSRAVEHYRDAATMLDPTDRYFAEAQTNLGVGLRERFEIFRDAADIGGAVAAARTAGGDHPTAEQLLNLGAALDARGEVLNDPAARNEAVDVYRAALATIERRHTARPGVLINLAQALIGRPEATDADVAEAVRLCAEAVRSGRQRDPLYQSTLAVVLRRRADLLDGRHPDGRWAALVTGARTGALRARALYLARRAVDLSPPDSPALARLLAIDAELTVQAGPRGGTPSRYRHAVAAFERAARSSSAPVAIRMAATRNWANVAMATGDRPTARRATEAAVELLPLVAWPGIARADRERELSAVGSVGGDAAAVAVADADLAAAITMVEQGRGILWARLLEQRMPLDAVRTATPDRAARLTEIRRQLDRRR